MPSSSVSFPLVTRLTRRTSIGLALLAGAVLAACSDTTGPVTGASTPAAQFVNAESSARREIFLRRPANAPFPNAHGKATFKTGGERELQIEVEDVRAGTRLVFFLGTRRLGTRTTNQFREARLELRGAAAPTSVAGKLVQVKTTTGRVVVFGRF
jgi:hypothetical protein